MTDFTHSRRGKLADLDTSRKSDDVGDLDSDASCLKKHPVVSQLLG